MWSKQATNRIYKIRVILHSIKYFPYLVYLAVKNNSKVMSLLSSTSYYQDNLATTNFMGFLDEKNFSNDFENSLIGVPENLKVQFRAIKYRAHVVEWCYNQTKNVSGDVIEIGVWYGVLSRFILERNSIQDIKKVFYLVDPWAGKPGSRYESDNFSEVVLRFKPFSNVKLVRGWAPEALYKLDIDDISFAIIDMNSFIPEIRSLEYLWPKLSKGSIIYFDDYAHLDCVDLRTVIDGFFMNKKEKLLVVPSGNAFVMKIE